MRKLSFTGSVPVGKLLAGKAAKHLVRCTFELGGHAPVIVLPDADPAHVAEQTCAFKFRNAGQVCISASRFFVHDTIYDDVLARFVERAKSLKVGDGREEGVQVGPMANLRRIAAMRELVEDAVTRCAKLMTGGERIGNRGYFFPPTVLAEVPDEARIMREEPFGPVAPFARFAEVEEAVARANALEYGLAAYVFGARPARRGAGGRVLGGRHRRRQRLHAHAGRYARRRRQVEWLRLRRRPRRARCLPAVQADQRAGGLTGRAGGAQMRKKGEFDFNIIRAMEVFVAVAEIGQVTKAAGLLGMTQSAASQQLRALEGAFGSKLVDRTSRPIRLTQAGIALHKRAAQILSEIEELKAQVRRMEHIPSAAVAYRLACRRSPARCRPPSCVTARSACRCRS